MWTRNNDSSRTVVFFQLKRSFDFNQFISYVFLGQQYFFVPMAQHLPSPQRSDVTVL
ncbi:Uncharacterized protein APZ42_024282 [Daphnia magna]|uniref:Uncharacterized protein n=1 Tax=Daphnia magna TaxID=35525 RepID=A0A164UMD0_9CRUS|nr:Uncharacterized protein APZ42_024282 [Daphnia magna]